MLLQPLKRCPGHNVHLCKGRGAQIVHHQGAGTARGGLEEVMAGRDNGLQHLQQQGLMIVVARVLAACLRHREGLQCIHRDWWKCLCLVCIVYASCADVGTRGLA